jgi:3-methyladenine DNA glycosylase AlkD
MTDIKKKLQSKLFELQDLKYKEFHCKLMPTVNPATVIGVRTPALRQLARELSRESEIGEFLNTLPHDYYEENNLHGFLIESTKDYATVIGLLEEFLPYVDNWATCDLMSPKVFKKHLPELYGQIKHWLKSGHTYTVRFAIGMLMSFYLDEAFRPEVLELVVAVHSEEYYVKMMIAWFFATALAKQYNATLPILQNQRLEKWTHNKTIQKAIESYRINEAQKTYLRSLKVK